MRTFLKTVVLLSILIFLVNCNKDNSPPVVVQNQSAQQVSDATMPTINRIVVVIEENHAYEQIIGSPNAPYINSLVRDEYGVLFTKSFGLTYGSQPNYFDLFSGSDQGIHSG